jgi:hypothetical protein
VIAAAAAIAGRLARFSIANGRNEQAAKHYNRCSGCNHNYSDETRTA